AVPADAPAAAWRPVHGRALERLDCPGRAVLLARVLSDRGLSPLLFPSHVPDGPRNAVPDGPGRHHRRAEGAPVVGGASPPSPQALRPGAGCALAQARLLVEPRAVDSLPQVRKHAR